MKQSTLDHSPSKLGKGKNGRENFLLRLFTSPTFLIGLSTGIGLYWLLSEVVLVTFGISRGGGSPPPPLPWPLEPPDTGGYHALIIPAGGQTPNGPPPHVLARLERAVAIYRMAAEPKPFVITTAWGTPHKPCPRTMPPASSATRLATMRGTYCSAACSRRTCSRSRFR